MWAITIQQPLHYSRQRHYYTGHAKRGLAVLAKLEPQEASKIVVNSVFQV